jgi:hypothetical protein
MDQWPARENPNIIIFSEFTNGEMPGLIAAPLEKSL